MADQGGAGDSNETVDIVREELKAVTQKIIVVEAQITKCLLEIEGCNDPEEKRQLRDKEKQLRDQANLLQQKELIFLQQSVGAGGASAGAGGAGAVDIRSLALHDLRREFCVICLLPRDTPLKQQKSDSEFEELEKKIATALLNSLKCRGKSEADLPSLMNALEQKRSQLPADLIGEAVASSDTVAESVDSDVTRSTGSLVSDDEYQKFKFIADAEAIADEVPPYPDVQPQNKLPMSAKNQTHYKWLQREHGDFQFELDDCVPSLEQRRAFDLFRKLLFMEHLEVTMDTLKVTELSQQMSSSPSRDTVLKLLKPKEANLQCLYFALLRYLFIRPFRLLDARGKAMWLRIDQKWFTGDSDLFVYHNHLLRWVHELKWDALTPAFFSQFFLQLVSASGVAFGSCDAAEIFNMRSERALGTITNGFVLVLAAITGEQVISLQAVQPDGMLKALLTCGRLINRMTESAPLNENVVVDASASTEALDVANLSLSNTTCSNEGLMAKSSRRQKAKLRRAVDGDIGVINGGSGSGAGGAGGAGGDAARYEGGLDNNSRGDDMYTGGRNSNNQNRGRGSGGSIGGDGRNSGTTDASCTSTLKEKSLQRVEPWLPSSLLFNQRILAPKSSMDGSSTLPNSWLMTPESPRLSW